MLRRGGPGRRIWLAVAMVVAGVLFAGGVAFAASETIVAGPGQTFSKATYTTDQGVVVQFQNLDGTSHNVTSRQAGLFASNTISSGTTPVNGTQFLGPGDYAFYCSIHPTTMNATLHVTGAGTPQTRPQLSLRVKGKSLANAIKKGILVAINASAKIDDVTLTAKLGKAVIGKASDLSLAAGQQADRVKLSKAGKRRLSGRDTAKVTVTATVPFGPRASTKATLR